MADTTRELTDEPAVPAAGTDGSAAGSADPAEAGAAGEPVADPAQARAHEEAAPARLLASYARSLCVFVGAGLIAGAVVHFPLAPVRYAALGFVGAALFAAGSTSEGIARRTPVALGVHLAASLGMAVGVGMVAGGVQHFSDIPGRAAVLIPLGLVIGLAAFAVRDGHRVARRHLAPLLSWSVAVAVALATGLSALAPAEAGQGAHGHGHGATGQGSTASVHGDVHTRAAQRGGDARPPAAHDAGEDDAAPSPRPRPKPAARTGTRTRSLRAQRRTAGGTSPRRASTGASRDAGGRRARRRLTDDEIIAAVRALEEKHVPRGG